ncbi:MAG: PilZ domain-containing protein [Candidatus Ranarchaeia archaeon]
MFGRRSVKETKRLKSKVRTVERRQRKRLKIKEGVFSILRGPSPQLGEITDASGGGLAFRYQGEEKLWKESSELEILALNDSFKIKRLPIRGVWDFKTANEMRKRGVQFGRLSHRQRSQLRFFMQNYSL